MNNKDKGIMKKYNKGNDILHNNILYNNAVTAV